MRSQRGILLVALLQALQATTVASAAAESPDATLAAARQAARENRNAESAKLFEEAVAEDPDRRLQLLPELGDQLTYSNQGSEAIPLYREAIHSKTLAPDTERHARLGLALALSWSHRLPEAHAAYRTIIRKHPDDVDALLGDARVLSWQDQLSASLREYERVLTVSPGNRDALDNIARVQNWRGRRRDAQAKARALLATDKNDTSAALTLAQSELWMGRPDLAARYDSDLLHTNPNDGSAKSLAADIVDVRRVQSSLTSDIGTQSDGLIIRNEDFQTSVVGAQGLTTLGVRYQPISYIGLNDAGDATERRLGLFARARLNDFSEINAAASNDEITSTGSSTRNLLLYNTYFTLWPNDTLRFDIGSRKETFDNLTSLRMGITAAYDSISVDVTPDENTHLSAQAYLGSLSDGNRQSDEQFQIERSVVRSPRLTVGAQLTNYTFAETLDNGYFDPPHYQSAALTTHWYGNVNGRLYYDVAGTFGREWVVDGGARATHSQHGALSYVLSRDLSLSALYDAFDTRQVSNGGFARTVFGFRVQSKW